MKCRSGQRLKLLLGDNWYERGDTEVTNSTPEVGYGRSNIKLPADPVWIERELERVKPKLVITCGTQALDAVSPLWDGPLVAVPHPSCRVLSNRLYEVVRAMIQKWPTKKPHSKGSRLAFEMDKDGLIRHRPIAVVSKEVQCA